MAVGSRKVALVTGSATGIGRACALRFAKLGFDVVVDEASRTATVIGRGGELPATSAELFCGNSGTTIRFVTALCSLGHGDYTLDGVARMRQRPIRELADLLIFLLVAGFDTSKNVLTLVMYEMTGRPEISARRSNRATATAMP